jgi:membrane-bound ClpP family serine protease
MNAIILCFLIGLVLLGFEVVVPGGILGVIGGVAMLGGCILAFTHYGMSGGMIAVLVGLLLAGGTLYLEIVLLPRTRAGKKMFLQSAVTGVSQSPQAGVAQLVGKTAKALTVLAPSGYVTVEGRKFEAYSESGHAAPGDVLRVTSVDQFTIRVTKL